MAATVEINTAAWVNELRALYKANPTIEGAQAVLMLVQQVAASAAAIRADIVVTPTGRERAFVRQLEAWDKAYAGFYKRYSGDGGYADDVNPCKDWAGGCASWENEGYGTGEEGATLYVDTWVMKPVLFGKFPPDYYLGVPTPGRADAYEVASLFNQIAQLAPLVSLTSDQLDELVGEWLLVVEREFSRSAPGEPATIGDWLADMRKRAGALISAIGSGIVTGAIVVGGVIAAGLTLWLWKGRRR